MKCHLRGIVYGIGCFVASTIVGLHTGCRAPQRVAHYDPHMDRMLTEIYKKHLTLFDRMDAHSAKDDYAPVAHDYKEVRRELLTLKARSETIDHNQLTNEQIKLALANLQKLEVLHQAYGFHDQALYLKIKESILDSIKTMIKLETSKLHGQRPLRSVQ